MLANGWSGTAAAMMKPGEVVVGVGVGAGVVICAVGGGGMKAVPLVPAPPHAASVRIHDPARSALQTCPFFIDLSSELIREACVRAAWPMCDDRDLRIS